MIWSKLMANVSIVSRLVFSYGKEDILGRHDAPVRCVEYSYAAGCLSVITFSLSSLSAFMFFFDL